MQADPLQQLRDVHTPVDPSWWPPAVGWWLLALMLLMAIGWCVYTLQQAHAKRRPIRQAKALLDQLHAQQQAGQLSADDFLQQGNELLKRLLVPALGKTDLAPLAGDAWLSKLDELTNSDSFTSGPGRILGNERFQAEPEIDPQALYQQFHLVMQKVKP